MTVYIPCYFNNIAERKENFYYILNQYLRLGYKVVLYWMNNEPVNMYDKNLIVIEASKVNASVARNKLLKIFYNSIEDYSIFSDDDTYLKSSVEIETGKDCISFTNDYNEGITNTHSISSSFLLLKNFKKFYNLEPLFDEYLEANQDLDFGISLNKLGIKTYRNSTKEVIIYKGESSMFSNDLNKIYKKNKTLQYIETKQYGNNNIKNI